MTKDEEERDDLRWVTFHTLINILEKARLAEDTDAVFRFARLVHELWQEILEHGDET